MKDGWEIKRLGDLFTFKNGRAFKKEEWSDRGLPIIRIQNLNRKDASFNYFTGEYSQDIFVNPGDLLFSWSGTIGTSFGSHIWSGEPGLLNQHIFKVAHRESINRRYAFYGLRFITAEIEKSVSGAVGLAHITKEKLNEFTLSLPPLPEQQRIVALLDEAIAGLANAKANAERNLQNSRTIFESHLQTVFSQRGEGWIETRLADICDRVSVGHVGPTSEFYCGASEGVPFLRSQNVRPGRLDWDGVQHITYEFHNRLRKSQLRFGDLLFVRVGANRGDCCAVLEDVAQLNCANIVFARPSRGNAAYLERYCQSPPGRAQLLGMTTGSAQGVINTKSVAELVIPIPKEIDQGKIVAKLNGLQDETQRLTRLYERKLAALEELKKSLLHQAFNGEL
jgi:type I restriction enzyme, S subunit